MLKHLFAALALLASFYTHASGVADFTKPNVPGAIPGGPRLPGAKPPTTARPLYLNPQPTISPTDAVAPAGPLPARDKAGAATITDAVFTYDQAGNRKSMTLSNGVVTEYFYDSRYRLLELHTTKDGATLQRHIYTVDASGLRTGVHSLDVDGTDRTVAWGHDKLRRLTSEVHTEQGIEVFNASYIYDKVGNRESAVVNGVTTTYEYDENDWLLSETAVGGPLPGTTTYTYDDNGNRLTKTGPLGNVEYTYNDANRMVEMRDGIDRITYDYSADGLLVAKTFFKPGLPPLTQRFVWDANRSIPQVMEESVSADGGAPRVVANYFFADDLIAQTRNGVTSFVVADGMGSTRGLTDTGGAVTDTFRYDAFGNVIGRTGSTPADHLYRGEQLDPNAGFYYLRARWMDPTIGRFTQMDSFAGFNSDPTSLHKYLYANADPVNRIDPSGHMSLMETTVAQNIQSTLRTLSTRGGHVLRAYNTARSIQDIVLGVRQVFSFIQGGSLDSLVPKHFPLRIDFADAAEKFVQESPKAIGSGLGNWVAGYIGDAARFKEPSAYIIYLPTLQTAGSTLIPTGAKINGKPIKVGLGGPGGKVGSLLGIGLVMGRERALYRMDIGLTPPGHGSATGGLKPGELAVWDRDPFSFHVYSWSGGPR